MERIGIAGFSRNFVSLLVECIHRRHPGHLHLDILVNTPPGEDDETPFAHPGDVVSVSESVRGDNTWYIGAGQPESKRSIVRFLNEKFPIVTLPVLTDPSAIIATTTRIGRGVVALENVVVGPFSTIGDFVTLNRQSSVGHHTTIGEFCTISPGAHIAGHCRIGNGVFIGMGAVVCDHIEIGDNSVIGAGSVVVRPIPAGVVAYGNPARIIRNQSTVIVMN